MATKTVILSDLGGAELTDDNHTRVQVKHPDLSFPVELDISSEEAGKLVQTTLRLIEFTIYEPNKPPRTAVMETKTVDQLFKGVELDKVLEGARKVEPPRAAASAPRKQAAPKAGNVPKTDYTDRENAGRPHRGRITDAEKQTVRDHLDYINKRLESEGHAPINPGDPATAEKWGFTS